MPIYEYRCANGHTFEVFQSMSEDPVTSCIECSAPAERVLTAPAVHFKGSGFYTTDYARKGAKKGADGAQKESKADAGGEGKATSGSDSGGEPAKKSESNVKSADS